MYQHYFWPLESSSSFIERCFGSYLSSLPCCQNWELGVFNFFFLFIGGAPLLSNVMSISYFYKIGSSSVALSLKYTFLTTQLILLYPGGPDCLVHGLFGLIPDKSCLFLLKHLDFT